MIRKKSDNKNKPIIDLTGEQGNAFCLLGHAKGWAKQLSKEWDPIYKDMTSGDYEHLLAVIEREFGDYVILER